MPSFDDPALPTTMDWPDIDVFGTPVSLAHVRPMRIAVVGINNNLPEPMTVMIRFSDHCFAESAAKSTTNPKFIMPWCSPNSSDQRAFSQERYDFTPTLINELKSIQNASVFTTSSRGVFLCITPHKNADGEDFAMYLRLAKASNRQLHHLELKIVSCYPSLDHKASVPHKSRAKKIRFKVLCGKVHRGEALNFF